MIAQQFAGKAEGVVRGNAAVGGDLQDQAFVIDLLPDAGGLDVIGHADDGGENRIDRDRAQGHIRLLVLFSRHIAAAAADAQLHGEIGVGVEGRDIKIGVEHFKIGRLALDVGGGDDFGSLERNQNPIRPFVDQFQSNLFEVEHDFGHIFFHARDCAELVQNVIHPEQGDGGTGDG
ncbi:MAG: hypothetical protein BWY83_00592 [bacterium ADurb.Bin478]|nr:MAG: hypothetical protein BWY83_00592 [bacterium ADurb.Bin478]